jgi:hypothetical protein
MVLMLAAGPALALASVECGVLLWGAVAGHPRWPDEYLNLSEAVAVRDTAEVVRLIEGGVDPDGRFMVRPGLVDNDRQVRITPLEAATAIRHAELVELLLERGARPTPDAWLRLRCVGEASGDEDLVAALNKANSGPDTPHCTGTETLW